MQYIYESMDIYYMCLLQVMTVGADEGILAQKGDVLAMHYHRQPVAGIVATYDNSKPYCCGMSDDKLSFIHNDATYDDMLPVGKILRIQYHISGKKRLPALKPLIFGKYVWLLVGIFDMLWYR